MSYITFVYYFIVYLLFELIQILSLFSFLVGDDCRIYEGRGWSVKSDKSLKFETHYNTRIDIAFIGDFRGMYNGIIVYFTVPGLGILV